MLLPYYIASMNIEHEYYAATDDYRPFGGICLVDTFDLAEDRQLPLFAPENTQRLDNQRQTPMFVVIGNPPYNVGQVNENDNNKNRRMGRWMNGCGRRIPKPQRRLSKMHSPIRMSKRFAGQRTASERKGLSHL